MLSKLSTEVQEVGQWPNLASMQISILDAQQGSPARNAWGGIVSFDFDIFDTFEDRLAAVLNLLRVSFLSFYLTIFFIQKLLAIYHPWHGKDTNNTGIGNFFTDGQDGLV